jgi:hypothetical protein
LAAATDAATALVLVFSFLVSVTTQFVASLEAAIIYTIFNLMVGAVT